MKYTDIQIKNNFLTEINYEEATIANKMTVLSIVGFKTGIFYFFLIVMTIASRFLDHKKGPLENNDSDTINMLNRHLKKLMSNFMVFMLFFTFYLFNKVNTGESLKDTLSLGCAWVFFRCIFVFASFIGRDIDLKALRLVGMVPSCFLILYFLTQNLGCNCLQKVYQ